MPGNPLPIDVINLEDRGWPYEDGTWGDIPVTAAPKAAFDAESGESVAGVRGFVKFSDEGYPNEVVPNSGGRRGIKIHFAAQDMWSPSALNEMNYRLLEPRPYVLERISLFQPANYEHPREMSFQASAATEFSGWLVGDALSTANGDTAVIAGFAGSSVGLVNFTGNPLVDWRNVVVTNDTRGGALTPIECTWKAGTSKFMQLWVSDSDTGRGYSNGMLALGSNPSFETTAPDNTGNAYIKINSSDTDAGLTTEQLAFSTPDNEVVGQANPPVLFDTTDNGTEISFFIERQRSSADGVPDGYTRIWKKTERPGGAYPSWTLLYKASGLDLYSSYNNNCWTHGYIAGNKNGGYRVATDFYYTRYELWFQRPDFLPLEAS